MKSIAVVLLVFGLVATGIGVFFIRQSSVTSTESQAYETITAFGNLVPSNCEFMYLSDCPMKKDSQLLVSIQPLVEKALLQYASPLVLRYREPVNSEVFSSLGAPNLLPVKPTYSVSDIITRISLSSGINYKLLIAVFAIQGKDAWNGDSQLSNAFGRKELSFADQMSAVAHALQSSYEGQRRSPGVNVIKGTVIYPINEGTNTASRALYIYFSHTLTDEQFSQILAPTINGSPSFQKTWYRLFPEDATRR